MRFLGFRQDQGRLSELAGIELFPGALPGTHFPLQPLLNDARGRLNDRRTTTNAAKAAMTMIPPKIPATMPTIVPADCPPEDVESEEALEEMDGPPAGAVVVIVTFC